jgi:hypothetical protein
VDAAVGPHLLAKHGHRVEGRDAGVERVHALPRIGRGVGGAARPLERHAHDTEQVLVEQGAIEAVDHHGAVHAREDARVHEHALAPAPLLGGRADHLDAAAGQAVAHRHQRGARAGPRRGDHVVSAGMPDAG